MTSKYADRQFWIDAADRAIATFAQAAIGTFGAGVTGILQVDPVQLASVGALAAVTSLLSSIAFRGGPPGDGATPASPGSTPASPSEHTQAEFNP
ncbi:holin [Agromyces sp. NBRC 114283]|uniref:holin n=1 Tax=Agromyces sp. NBRC 114283 TaxID=2994521 RepID=UPI0024A110F6|nr:holin [Agromyces sp. NBRC 114283]GLU88196.1 hypothetical protein Agsp01_04510 [Agromyces sp. NBRC 114283]